MSTAQAEVAALLAQTQYSVDLQIFCRVPICLAGKGINALRTWRSIGRLWVLETVSAGSHCCTSAVSEHPRGTATPVPEYLLP